MATILILDDRPTNRELLVTLLNYAGHDMLEATTAQQALTIAFAQHLDLIIADVLMPDIDGFEFVRLLRNEPSIAHTRVIFYTATYIESETRAIAASLGVTHMLTKPSDPQDILNTVQAALGMPAMVVAPPSVDVFAQEHQRLLLDKLAQKIDQLEVLNAGLATMNAELEERVSARTAELSNANARLSELNAVKDNLVAITSHDLRSPLGAIHSMVEILLEEYDLPAQARILVRQIDSVALNLVALVSNMLDLSKLEAGKVALEPIELRVSQVVKRSLETLQASAQAKQIDTQLIVEPGERPVLADWLKLSQILNNLVSNAIKFTPSGGKVTVRVENAGAGIWVRVADTGLGIPPDDLPALFDRFRQYHRRGTANEHGSGLGLAIVWQLVELHGGTIMVTSEVGHGSMFSVYLPEQGTAAISASQP